MLPHPASPVVSHRDAPGHPAPSPRALQQSSWEGETRCWGGSFFKKDLVELPNTAAGSACRKLKRRGKLFIQRYLAGQEDAIAQATVTTQARQVTAEP